MPRLSITWAAAIGSISAFGAAWFSRYCGLERVEPSPSHTQNVESPTNPAVVLEDPYGLVAHDCFGPAHLDSFLGAFALIVLPLALGLMLRPTNRAPLIGAGLVGMLSALAFALCLALLRGRSNAPLVVFAVLVSIGGLTAIVGSWIRSRVPSNSSLGRRRDR